MINKISPISFTSTYKVSTTSNEKELKAFEKFRALCDSMELTEKGVSRFQEEKSENRPQLSVDPISQKWIIRSYGPWSAEKTLVTSDKNDSQVEAYLKVHNISYKKYTKDDLTLPLTLQRVKNPKPKMIKAYINAQKLEDLTKNQDSNFQHCRKDYYNLFKPIVNYNLKSADDFDTTTLLISSNTSLRSTMEYIKRYGAGNLDKGQISIDFCQRTAEPDHCVYFGLKEMGAQDIPVYMNNDSYKIARELGILSEDMTD